MVANFNSDKMYTYIKGSVIDGLEQCLNCK